MTNCFAKSSFLSAELLFVAILDKDVRDLVVDLHGCAPAAADYDGDTLQTVFSSTKCAAATVFALAQDRGLLRYDDLVSKHWPEFGCNGFQLACRRGKAAVAKYLAERMVDTTPSTRF